MGNMPYIEAINHSSVSLYDWVKQNPKMHIPALYTGNVPSILLTRAERFQDWFASYPGDGTLFFHDVLLSPLSMVQFKYHLYCPPEYSLFFNYLYSYKSSFTPKSCGVLTVFLQECPYLSVPLYKYRKQFDPDAFTALIDKVESYNSFQEYTYTTNDAGKYITRFIWQVILGYQAPLGICDNSILMHIYYGYTYTAIKRFFLLSTTKAVAKQHIENAYDVYKQTYLLFGIWQEDITLINSITDRKIPQMSSIKAMIHFHDMRTEELLAEQLAREKEQMALETQRYTWDALTEVIKTVSPEWYIPEYATEIRIRGQQHHNCIGGYIERHFHPHENNFKMLLLFTDYCEAEVHITLGEVKISKEKYYGEFLVKSGECNGCTNASIQQAKTSYNNDIPPSDIKELEKITLVFRKLPAEFFDPVVKQSE